MTTMGDGARNSRFPDETIAEYLHDACVNEVEVSS
jgi:hypothetical protein